VPAIGGDGVRAERSRMQRMMEGELCEAKGRKGGRRGFIEGRVVMGRKGGFPSDHCVAASSSVFFLFYLLSPFLFTISPAKERTSSGHPYAQHADDGVSFPGKTRREKNARGVLNS
jgi:hypothetical protein